MTDSSVLLAGLPIGVIQDQYGNALSGRAIFVYERDTGNQVQVYSDENLVYGITQPLITADGAIPGYVASGTSIDVVDQISGIRTQAEPLSASLVVGATTISEALPGNLTGIYTLAAFSNQIEMVRGTLTGNLTVLVIPIEAGSLSLLTVTQDGTGSHTVTISDGTNESPVVISPTAGSTSQVLLTSTDGSTVDALSLGAPSAGASGVTSFNTRTGAVVPASGDYTVSQVTGAAPLASPALTGTPTAPTPTAGDNDTSVATTAFVTGAVSTETTARTTADALLAPKASPALTGTPTVPTAAVNTNTTQAASTAFVLAQAATATPVIDGTAAVGTSTTLARADHVHPTDTTRAALASPTLTGTPAAPTATAGTNTTQLATTAFVTTAASAKANVGESLDRLRMAAWAGVQSEPYPLGTATNANITTTGKMQASLIGLQAGMVLTGVIVSLSVAAASLTGCYVALYSTGGTLLTTSTPLNQTSALGTSASVVALPFYASGTYTVPATGAYFAAILCVGGTQPTLVRGSASAYWNGIGSGVPLYVSAGGQTTPGSTVTFAKDAQSFYLAVY